MKFYEYAFQSNYNEQLIKRAICQLVIQDYMQLNSEEQVYNFIDDLELWDKFTSYYEYELPSKCVEIAK